MEKHKPVNGDNKEKKNYTKTEIHDDLPYLKTINLPQFRKVIYAKKPYIGASKTVSRIEEIDIIYTNYCKSNPNDNVVVKHFKDALNIGYSQSKETHQFNRQEVVKFVEFYNNYKMDNDVFQDYGKILLIWEELQV